MRVAGVLVAIVGALVGVVFLLVPARTSEVLGSSASCGIPILTTFVDHYEDDGQDFTDSVNSECRQQSVIHVGIGVLVGLVGLGAGSLMFFLTPSAETRERERREEEHKRFERWRMDRARQWEHENRARLDREAQQRQSPQPPPYQDPSN